MPVCDRAFVHEVSQVFIGGCFGFCCHLRFSAVPARPGVRAADVGLSRSPPPHTSFCEIDGVPVCDRAFVHEVWQVLIGGCFGFRNQLQFRPGVRAAATPTRCDLQCFEALTRMTDHRPQEKTHTQAPSLSGLVFPSE